VLDWDVLLGDVQHAASSAIAVGCGEALDVAADWRLFAP
jgi:hypothetical protein